MDWLFPFRKIIAAPIDSNKRRDELGKYIRDKLSGKKFQGIISSTKEAVTIRFYNDGCEIYTVVLRNSENSNTNLHIDPTNSEMTIENLKKTDIKHLIKILEADFENAQNGRLPGYYAH
jgi:hypothetical protein